MEGKGRICYAERHWWKVMVRDGFDVRHRWKVIEGSDKRHWWKVREGSAMTRGTSGR